MFCFHSSIPRPRSLLATITGRFLFTFLSHIISRKPCHSLTQRQPREEEPLFLFSTHKPNSARGSRLSSPYFFGISFCSASNITIAQGGFREGCRYLLPLLLILSGTILIFREYKWISNISNNSGTELRSWRWCKQYVHLRTSTPPQVNYSSHKHDH